MSKLVSILKRELARKPNQTALEIWTELRLLKRDNPDVYKMIKLMLPEADQSIREAMAVMEKEGLVKHRIKFNSILKEWRLA